MVPFGNLRDRILKNSINYGKLMHQAMRGLMAEVLRGVAEKGLPGKHHFYITIDTKHPGVDMSDALKARFPDEITVVMQDWFDDLAVMHDRFHVTLNFSNVREPLVIPFDSIKRFVDPSVEFGLQFEAQEAEIVAEAEQKQPKQPAKKPSGSSGVVSLDAFRKS